MSGTLRLRGTTSGYSELQAPAVAGDQTFILPATGGTLLTTASPAPTLTLESGTVTSPSLTFEGDSNTGIYSPGANQLAITTGGGQRLIVNNVGRVGIGTASPDAQLKVQTPNSDSITSAFAVRQNNAADSAQATCIIEQDPLNSSSRIIANGTTTPSLKLGTASTVGLTINSTQQVGIGTESPTTALHVVGTPLFQGTMQVKKASGSSEGGEIKLFNPDDTTTGATIDISSTDAFRIFQLNNNSVMELGQLAGTGGTIRFATAGSERMRIDSNGEIGIGKTNPSALLDVNGTCHVQAPADTWTNSSQFHIANIGSLSTQGSFRLSLTSNGYRNGSGNWTTLNTNSQTGASQIGLDPSGFIEFCTEASKATGSSSGVTRRMILTNGGYVGINTSSPGNHLDVNGSVSGTNFLGRTGVTAMTIGIPGTDTAFVLYGSGFSSDPSRILFRTGSTNRGEVDAIGRLVLGGISPGTSIGYSFCTSGRLQTIASYTNTTGSGANMHIASNGLVIRSTSSIRYKTDIETLEDSYADKLLECRPVWYRSTATDDTAHPEWGYYGFIAEEVADVDPRLVHFDEQEDGTLQPEGVQYTQMIAHLVNIVKRQKQQLVDFEARLSDLETAN